MMSAGPGLFIVHRALPGRRDDVQRVWETHMRPAVATNPGHLAYAYTFDDADPDVIRVFQHYASREDSAAFLAGTSYAAYARAVEPLLAGAPELHAVTVCWTKA